DLGAVANDGSPRTFEPKLAAKAFSNKQKVSSENDRTAVFNSILGLIENGNVQAAANAINEQYSDLSSAELDSLKAAFLVLAYRSGGDTKNTLLAASKAFDDLDIWKYLAAIASRDNDWNTAFSANLRASELENNSSDLNLLLESLVIVSGHLRATYEANGDLISIRDLYRRLSDLHPNFQRFQYQLAISKITLGETDDASRLLESLRYDPQLGQVSEHALAKIAALRESDLVSGIAQAPAKQTATDTRDSDIVVPLISAGSSFLVDSIIERQSARLLLDTGASITSLSSQLVERLKLEPSGQSVRLNTANGVTNARIYRVKQLRLNNLVLRDILIAEINLANNSKFQGLLGTDALNQFKSRYSYIIDNQKNTLIFRAR
ncbi:MAG: putative aspartyl protease, partial [Arenicella sp.]